MAVKIYAEGRRRGASSTGCCSLTYQGYTISISTIAQPPEILVFNTKTKEDLCTLPARAEGVRQAMLMIEGEVAAQVAAAERAKREKET